MDSQADTNMGMGTDMGKRSQVRLDTRRVEGVEAGRLMMRTSMPLVEDRTRTHYGNTP